LIGRADFASRMWRAIRQQDKAQVWLISLPGRER
jgi:hypothetical protein